MEEQAARAPDAKVQDVLSWQFILLIVVIAVLVPLISAAPVTIERSPAPVPTAVPVDYSAYQYLNELALTATYDDPSGVSISYPEDWLITPIRPGFFVLSNYPVDGSMQTIPADLVVTQFQTGAMENFTLPDGSPPAPGTDAHDIMQAMLASVPEPIAITDLTVDGSPAASIHLTRQGAWREITLVTPNENALVFIDFNTSEGNWENVNGLHQRLLEAVRIMVPAS